MIGPAANNRPGLAATGILAAIFVAAAFFAAALDRFPGDLAVSLLVQSWNSPLLEAVSKAASLEENRLVILSLMLVVVFVLFLFRWRRESYFLLGSTVSGVVVIELTKALVARPRPTPDLVLVLQDVSSQSFPSGNVALFSVYLIALALAVASRTADRRKAIAAWGLSAALLTFIGLSRIYLGAHWLSDVLAGYLLGLMWVLVIAQIMHALSHREANAD
ncbi:MAG: phosphatase PAP2 family protein [Chloroflexi bacterium]|nr:phosphatase PAP2 family protein [Chloroflexota bacterium]